jgi:hypothetical protein
MIKLCFALALAHASAFTYFTASGFRHQVDTDSPCKGTATDFMPDNQHCASGDCCLHRGTYIRTSGTCAAILTIQYQSRQDCLNRVLFPAASNIRGRSGTLDLTYWGNRCVGSETIFTDCPRDKSKTGPTGPLAEKDIIIGAGIIIGLYLLKRCCCKSGSSG